MYLTYVCMHFWLITKSFSLDLIRTLSDGWLYLFRSVTLCSTWLGNFSCEKRNAFEQFNECFQVFITSLNLTKIKNGFNYIFALITTNGT